MTKSALHPTPTSPKAARGASSILMLILAVWVVSCSSDDSSSADSAAPEDQKTIAVSKVPRGEEAVEGAPVGTAESSPKGEESVPSVEPPVVSLRELDVAVLLPGGEPATVVPVRVLDMERVPRASILRATGGEPDAEKLLEVLGEEKMTDSRGRATFEVSGGGLLASASLGKLFVMQPFPPVAEDTEVLTLQLAIDSSVRARAVDASGSPVTGIPIALSMELPTPGAETASRWIDLAVRETSGDDGTVRFRDPRGGVQSPGGEHPSRFGLRAAIPGLASPTPMIFDPDAAPETPLDIAVPPLSTFVVEVLSPSGHRLDIDADVFVEAHGATTGSKSRARLEGGRATFTAVVPGTLLRVTVQPLDGSAAFEGVGPAAERAGDVATISVSMSQSNADGGR